MSPGPPCAARRPSSASTGDALEPPRGRGQARDRVAVVAWRAIVFYYFRALAALRLRKHCRLGRTMLFALPIATRIQAPVPCGLAASVKVSSPRLVNQGSALPDYNGILNDLRAIDRGPPIIQIGCHQDLGLPWRAEMFPITSRVVRAAPGVYRLYYQSRWVGDAVTVDNGALYVAPRVRLALRGAACRLEAIEGAVPAPRAAA